MGTGCADVVIVDKDSGKYRLGYQSANGLFSWVDCRPSGVKGIAGFSIGNVLAPNQQALAFSSARRQPAHPGRSVEPHRPRQTRGRGFHRRPGAEHRRGD